MQPAGLHEDFSRSGDPTIGSERNFGLVIGGALAVLGVLSWYRGGFYWPWLLAASASFAIAALAAPRLLRPLNRFWFRFGLILARVVQPIVLGLMFYVILTPFAVLFRRFSKVPLGVGSQTGDASYWIRRASERPKDDLRNQF